MNPESAVNGPLTLISRQISFSSGRNLGYPNRSEAQNLALFGRDCLPHGHNYTVDVAYRGQADAVTGMIVNLTDLKPALAEASAGLADQYLCSSSPQLDGLQPTAENLLLHVWNRLPESIGGGTLHRARLQESVRVTVEKTSYSMIVFRSYEFAAAHRLFSPQLTGEANWQTYDKCSNPAGHGHNYQLQVGVRGEPDAETGFIIPPVVLDEIVQEEIFARFDHKHLNVDCPEFAEMVPTSENLAQVIFHILQRRLETEGWTLARVGLHETQKNYFEVEA